MIPQFFDPFSPWKLHVRYLTRRYYPELYRSLRFHGIFVISAGLTTYKREKYVNIYVHMYIYILYILLYISKYIYSFHVYKYIYVYLYTVYKQNMYIFTYLYRYGSASMGVGQGWAPRSFPFRTFRSFSF